MEPSSPEQEINRIERELDAIKPPGGLPPFKPGGGGRGRGGSGGQAGKPSNKSLDAVLVTALLLFVVSAALVFAGRLTNNQRMQLTAGSVGAAVGLLIGYGVGRLRP